MPRWPFFCWVLAKDRTPASLCFRWILADAHITAAASIPPTRQADTGGLALPPAPSEDTSRCASSPSGTWTPAHGSTAIWEGEITERYGDIDYTYPIVEVYEFDDDLKITRKHNYYDKLAILRQIAARLPGVQGAVYRFLLDRVIDAGETGLTTPRS